MIKTTKDKLRKSYIRNFNRFWWTIAAFFLALSIGTLAHTVFAVEHLAKDTQDAVKTIQAERAERVRVQDSINAYICRANDEQDGLLTELIVASLSSGSSALSGTEAEGRDVFLRALNALRNKPACENVVKEIRKP